MRAFHYVRSLPVTWQRWLSHHSIHSWKPPWYTQISWPIFYKIRVTDDQNFTLWERRFFLLFVPVTLNLTNDLHIQIRAIFPGDTPDVQIWTSYIRLSKIIVWQTYIQTDTTEIIHRYHAVSQVVNNYNLVNYTVKYYNVEKIFITNNWQL